MPGAWGRTPGTQTRDPEDDLRRLDEAAQASATAGDRYLDMSSVHRRPGAVGPLRHQGDGGAGGWGRATRSGPVTTVLVIPTTVLAALLALAGVASTVARRRIGLLHLVLAGVTEALLVVMAALALVRLAGETELPETATFLGYLAGALLLPVAGVLFARTETSRWAGTVLAVPAATVAVMVWRLLQLWQAGGG